MSILIFLLLSSGLIAADQWTKYLTVTHLQLGETHAFLPGFLSFTYVRNTGAAWSILEGQHWFFFIVTVVVVAAVGYFMWQYRAGSRWLLTALSFVLAGALGNFIDRMRLGYVVDMLQTDFMNFPIFNVADMALVVGGLMLFIYFILEERRVKEGKHD